MNTSVLVRKIANGFLVTASGPSLLPPGAVSGEMYFATLPEAFDYINAQFAASAGEAPGQMRLSQ